MINNNNNKLNKNPKINPYYFYKKVDFSREGKRGQQLK
jgi:hypothetical protein